MKKYLNKFLILIGILLMFTTSVSAASKPAYTAVPMANENKTMTYSVFKVDWGKNPDEAWRQMLLGKTEQSLVGDVKGSDELAQITYPSLDWGSLLSSSARDSDYDIANLVMGLVTSNMNSLVSFIEKWSHNGIESIDTADFYDQLSVLLSTEPGREVQVASTLFRIERVSQEEADSIIKTSKGYAGITDASDPFIKVVAFMADSRYSSGNSVIIARYIPHGYYEGQLYKDKQLQDATYNESAKYVELSQIATFVANNDRHNLEFGNFYTKTSLEDNFDTMFGALNTSLLDRLGFDDPSKLVFNDGERAQNYYLGMMPLQWWNIANLLFWGFEIIAIVMLFGSVIAMILRQNLATVSPTIRNTIKDSIASLIMSIFMLMAYAPIFYVLGKVNMMLVEVFASFATSGLPLSDGWAAGISWVIKLLLFFVNAGLIIKINIDYFTRAVMITVLHVIAPVAIASLAYKQPGSRGLFNSWLKELTGCIFMQSFNALLLAIMFSLLRGSSSQWWHTQAALFMLCSLNGWFKQLFGFSDSVSQIAGNVQSQAKNATAQAVNNAQTLVGAGAGLATGAVSGFVSGGIGGAMSGAMSGAFNGTGGNARQEGNFTSKIASKATSGLDPNDIKNGDGKGEDKTKKSLDMKDSQMKYKLNFSNNNNNVDTSTLQQTDYQSSSEGVDIQEGDQTSETDQPAVEKSSGVPHMIASATRGVMYGAGTVARVATTGFDNALDTHTSRMVNDTMETGDKVIDFTENYFSNKFNQPRSETKAETTNNKKTETNKKERTVDEAKKSIGEK